MFGREKTKVFQKGDHDCGMAGLATLLNIPYEDAPDVSETGINLSWDRNNDVYWSNIDDWLKEHGLRWGKLRKRRLFNPFKYYIGVMRQGGYTLHGFARSHMVIMKGLRIWHDPETKEYTQTPISFTLTLEKIKK